jgi:type II secretory pathway pseudopilin PulG
MLELILAVLIMGLLLYVVFKYLLPADASIF